jgi:uncharacterized RDD family membrane protein YckC
MVYDVFPVLVIWMLMSAAALLVNPSHDHFAPWSLGQWLLYIVCWAATGVYAVESWARGGQTMGMRPWRLRVVASDGTPAKRKALWKRYAIASLGAALPLLWSMFDKERRGLHDIFSDTALVRIEAKR